MLGVYYLSYFLRVSTLHPRAEKWGEDEKRRSAERQKATTRPGRLGAPREKRKGEKLA